MSGMLANAAAATMTVDEPLIVKKLLVLVEAAQAADRTRPE